MNNKERESAAQLNLIEPNDTPVRIRARPQRMLLGMREQSKKAPENTLKNLSFSL